MASEPPLQVRRQKLTLQYCVKLASNPCSPDYSCVFNPQFKVQFTKKPNQIATLGIRTSFMFLNSFLHPSHVTLYPFLLILFAIACHCGSSYGQIEIALAYLYKVTAVGEFVAGPIDLSSDVMVRSDSSDTVEAADASMAAVAVEFVELLSPGSCTTIFGGTLKVQSNVKSELQVTH